MASKGAISLSVKTDTKKLRKLLERAPRAGDEVLGSVAFDTERFMKQLFNTGPAGRRYGSHIASAPEFPPNVDTGKYRNSITAKRKALHSWTVQTDTEYAPILEFGSQDGRLEKRPVFMPGKEHAEKLLPKRVSDMLNGAIQ